MKLLFDQNVSPKLVIRLSVSLTFKAFLAFQRSMMSSDISYCIEPHLLS